MAKGKSVFIDSAKNICKRYFVDATGAMALGLFASLILGTIVSQILKLPFLAKIDSLAGVAEYISAATGAAIGIAIAWGLKAAPLVMFSSAATGMIGYTLGGPLGAYLASVFGAETGNLIAGRTKADILFTPLVTVICGGAAGVFAGPYISNATETIGEFINTATELHPIPMGIIVAVTVGLTLTAPLSSAGICLSIGLSGIAAGAACVGCCCQMVGFAVASYKDNGIGGLISQAFGTSMLQLHNILRRPQIWLAPTLAAAILGPISAAVVGMTSTPYGAGMGTCGLVGQFESYHAMTDKGISPLMSVCIIIVMHIVAPAAVTLVFDALFRKLGWINKGDMKLKKI